MDVKFIATTSTRLPQLAIVNGQLIYLSDKSAAYYDMGGARHSISGVSVVNELPGSSDAESGILYIVSNGSSRISASIWDSTANEYLSLSAQIATTIAPGIVQPDGTTITIDENGVISAAQTTPTSHASTADTYGLGTTALYGHVKTIDSLGTTAQVDGEALSAHQGNVLANDIGIFEPTATAAYAHSEGEYFMWIGQFVKVTADIDVGDTIASGTNVAPTTISEVLNQLNSNIGKEITLAQWEQMTPQEQASGTWYITDAPGGSSGGGHTIINPSGTSMTDRAGLQFTGKVNVTDNSEDDATVVDITAPNEYYFQTYAEAAAATSTFEENDSIYVEEGSPSNLAARVATLETDKQPKTMSTTIAGQTTVEGALAQINSDLSDKQNQTMSQAIAGETTVEGCLSTLNSNLLHTSVRAYSGLTTTANQPFQLSTLSEFTNGAITSRSQVKGLSVIIWGGALDYDTGSIYVDGNNEIVVYPNMTQSNVYLTIAISY